MKIYIVDFFEESDNLVDVEVEFDYEAELGDELSLKTGDIVENVKRMDGGWWEGTLNGKRGVFPDNFVKVRHHFSDFIFWGDFDILCAEFCICDYIVRLFLYIHLCNV